MAPKRRKEIEDPDNTWNQQLMAACLRLDAQEAATLIEKGADPAKAREETPFSKGDRLSPLAAVILQGNLFSQEAIDTLQLLIEHGASVDDRMPLPGPAHKAAATPAGAAAATASGVTFQTEEEKKNQTGSQFSRPGSPSSGVVGAEINSVLAAGNGTDANSAGLPSALQSSRLSPMGEECDQGTLLHYLVALGDHAHLMQALTVGGVLHKPPTSAANMVGPGTSTSSVDPYAHPGTTNTTISSSHRNHQQQQQSYTPRVPHTSTYCVLPHSLLREMELEIVPLASLGGTLTSVGGGETAPSSPSRMGSRSCGGGGIMRRRTQSKSPNRSGGGAGGNADGAGASGGAWTSAMDQMRTPKSSLPALSAIPGTSGAVPCRLYTSAKPKQTTTASGGNAAGLAAAAAAAAGTDTPVMVETAPSAPRGEEQQEDEGDARVADSKIEGEEEKESSASAAATATQLTLQKPANASAPPSGRKVEVIFDFSVTTSRTALTALELAISLGDVLAARLLLFYGAPYHTTPQVVLGDGTVVQGDSNGADGQQLTSLARACVMGDVAEVERLLDCGDSLTQISADGRYTLIHYAAGQPQTMNYLVRRGLSVETENAFGDSALISLIRYGTGRNADYAVREAPHASDTAKLAALPYAGLRNYILTPIPPLVSTSGSKSKSVTGGGGGGSSSARSQSSGTGGGKNAGTREIGAIEELFHTRNVLGGGEMGTWWAFSTQPTADMIANLIECNANFHGYVPDDELDLAYVQFAERPASPYATDLDIAAAAAAASPPLIPNGKASAGLLRQGVPWRTSSHMSMSSMFTNDIGAVIQSNHHINNNSINNISPSMSTARYLANSISQPYYGSPNDDTEAGAYPPSNTTATLVPARVPLRATPLMHAIFAYHPEVIRKLAVDYRVDVMRRDSQGACALHYAAAFCRSASVMELLTSFLVVPNAVGFDVNAIDMAGRTPLHYAAAKGNVEVVSVLLALGTTVLAGKPDGRGLTPLHLAVLANETGVVKLLVHHSSTIVGALSQLQSAAAAASTSTHGGSGSRRGHNTGGGGGGGNAGSGSGRQQHGRMSGTSSRAASSNRKASMPHGVGGGGMGSDHGSLSPAFEHITVDIEAEDYEERATPLEMAIKHHRHGEIVEVLLNEGNASFIRASGLDNGGTLLHRAVADKKIEYVSILLQYYADPNESDEADHTPLHIAVSDPVDPCVEVVRCLLENGAWPHAQSCTTLKTPLHLAAAAVAPSVSLSGPSSSSANSSSSNNDSSGAASAVSAAQVAKHRAEVLVLVFHTPNPFTFNNDASAAAGAGPVGMTNGAATGSHSSPFYDVNSNLSGTSCSRVSARASSSARTASPLTSRRQSRRRLQLQGDEKAAAPSPLGLTGNSSGNSGRRAPSSRRWPTDAQNSFDLLPSSIASRGDDCEEDDTVAYMGDSQKIGSKTTTGASCPLVPMSALLLTDSRGRTPLHVLCSHASREGEAATIAVIREILRRKSERSEKKKERRSISDDNDVSGAKDEDEMVSVRALCALVDCDGRTALHDACRAGFVDAVQVLISCDPGAIFAVDARGCTPLHECVASLSSWSLGRSAVTQSLAILENEREEENKDEAATERRRAAAAVESIMDLIANVVCAVVPYPLRGNPLTFVPAASAVTAVSVAQLSITSQLMQRRKQRMALGGMPPASQEHHSLHKNRRTGDAESIHITTLTKRRTPAAAAPTPSSFLQNAVVKSWKEYCALTDSNGRTPLLLAAEVGNMAASSKLMKLSQKYLALSS